MFPLKMRFVALGLVMVFAGLLANGFLTLDAQQADGPKAKDAKVKQLLKERLALMGEIAKMERLRFLSGQGTVEELMAATALEYHAALEAAESDKDRVTLLEKYLAQALDTERIAAKASKAGLIRESSALKARAERLRIEITLERARDKQSARPAQGKNVGAGKAYPISIEPFETVSLYSRLPGYLKSQSVDIGDRVQRGQILAVIDVPEVEAQVRQDELAVAQARARVAQAKLRVAGAKAEADAAKATLTQTESTVKSAAASVRYRTSQQQRMKSLFEAKSIDQRLLDESTERLEAAQEAERSAKAAIAVAKAQLLVSLNKVEQAEAAMNWSEGAVKTAQVKLDLSQRQLSSARIQAPIDGVVTHRGYFPGDFIRSGSDEGKREPICMIQRFDKLRIVLAISERQADLITVGAKAELEIDAYPNKKWSVQVTRVGLFRAEFDLPNPDGRIRPGMTGNVTMLLGK